jgi:hypothetical protein
MNVHSNTLDFCHIVYFILVTWLASVSKYRNIFLNHKRSNKEEIFALCLDDKKKVKPIWLLLCEEQWFRIWIDEAVGYQSFLS